jgi:hypothetical protein
MCYYVSWVFSSAGNSKGMLAIKALINRFAGRGRIWNLQRECPISINWL